MAKKIKRVLPLSVLVSEWTEWIQEWNFVPTFLYFFPPDTNTTIVAFSARLHKIPIPAVTRHVRTRSRNEDRWESHQTSVCATVEFMLDSPHLHTDTMACTSVCVIVSIGIFRTLFPGVGRPTRSSQSSRKHRSRERESELSCSIAISNTALRRFGIAWHMREQQRSLRNIWKVKQKQNSISFSFETRRGFLLVQFFSRTLVRSVAVCWTELAVVWESRQLDIETREPTVCTIRALDWCKRSYTARIARLKNLNQMFCRIFFLVLCWKSSHVVSVSFLFENGKSPNRRPTRDDGRTTEKCIASVVVGSSEKGKEPTTDEDRLEGGKQPKEEREPSRAEEKKNTKKSP